MSKPHIHEVEHGKYILTVDEKIISEENNLRDAIEKVGGEFIFTPYGELRRSVRFE